MFINEVESLFDPKSLVCSSPRHSNDKLYSSINQKLKTNSNLTFNSESSNFSDLFNFVEKSSLVDGNSDKIKNVDSPELSKTIENKSMGALLNTIDACKR